MFQYAATIIRWVDGDTVRLNVDLGFCVHAEINARLSHVDTPEIINFDAQGLNDPARNWNEEHCPVGSVCVAETTKLDKYGRYLVNILYKIGEVDPLKILGDPQCLNQDLLKLGYAKPYEGGKK
jgi:micrococcal nuclease